MSALKQSGAHIPPHLQGRMVHSSLEALFGEVTKGAGLCPLWRLRSSNSLSCTRSWIVRFQHPWFEHALVNLMVLSAYLLS